MYISDFWNVDVTGMFSLRKVLLLGDLIRALRVIIDFSWELVDIPLLPNCLIGMNAD